jgi:hypothetical protein
VILECRRPVLIVEGPGDVAAVPRLIRETLHRREIFDLRVAPRPKRNVDLKNSGVLENSSVSFSMLYETMEIRS